MTIEEVREQLESIMVIKSHKMINDTYIFNTGSNILLDLNELKPIIDKFKNCLITPIHSNSLRLIFHIF